MGERPQNHTQHTDDDVHAQQQSVRHDANIVPVGLNLRNRGSRNHATPPIGHRRGGIRAWMSSCLACLVDALGEASAAPARSRQQPLQ